MQVGESLPQSQDSRWLYITVENAWIDLGMATWIQMAFLSFVDPRPSSAEAGSQPDVKDAEVDVCPDERSRE